MRRWQRELIHEMREETGARRAEHARLLTEHERWRIEHERWLTEHERWLTEFEQYRAEWRAQVEADRRAFEASQAAEKRRFDALDAGMENDKRITRETVIELRQQTSMLRDLQHRMRSTTEGLLRVLDEFRRNDGPSPAGA